MQADLRVLHGMAAITLMALSMFSMGRTCNQLLHLRRIRPRHRRVRRQWQPGPGARLPG
jgi:hypothetical protein